AGRSLRGGEPARVVFLKLRQRHDRILSTLELPHALPLPSLPQARVRIAERTEVRDRVREHELRYELTEVEIRPASKKARDLHKIRVGAHLVGKVRGRDHARVTPVLPILEPL